MATTVRILHKMGIIQIQATIYKNSTHVGQKQRELIKLTVVAPQEQTGHHDQASPLGQTSPGQIPHG